MSFARPEPPYYAVIITSALTGNAPEGYAAMNKPMAELGRAQPGYLGRERWYARYHIEVARVERAYGFESAD